jgi:hypothetical protein
VLRGFARSLFLLTGFAAALFAVVPVEAQEPPDDCDDDLVRGPLEIFPAFGVSGVRRDAPVRVRYSAGFFDDPSIGLTPDEAFDLFFGEDLETATPVPGTVELVGDELIFTPDQLLEVEGDYIAVALGELDDFEATFKVGSDVDRQPPELPPISGFSAAEIGPSCDAPDGGYRIDITIPAATDDGPKGDVEYLLYLTRGPTIEAPVLKQRARGVTEDQVVMAFALPLEDVAGPICVAVRAVDGVGKIDEDERVRCEDPIQGNFFEPLCSASIGRRSAVPLGWLLPLAAVVLVRLRRRAAR